ncbi:MAG: hypothetical protein M3P44_14810 [Actinomycetota bacterium]|nr:hypothetical protein [Actinomycetota bacterium]
MLAPLAVLLIPASASAATKTVAAGPPLTKPPAGVPEYSDATQFFRKTTTVNVGDTVSWKLFGFHTIYFPKKGGPNAYEGGDFLMTDPSRTYNETDPAGAPFWFNGQAQWISKPAGVFPLGGKTENGSRINASGTPQGPPDKFSYKLKFTKAGTYTYFCTIHPHMQARIKVLRPGAPVPSAAADKQAVAKQLAATIADLKSADKRADAAGAVVEAGRDTNRFSLLHFFPASKTVPVGTTVDFRMSSHTEEIHTVTFGSDAVLGKKGYAEKLSSAFFSPLPGTGKNGPPELGTPGALYFPSDQGALSFNGSQHGGFLNAGLLGEKPLPSHSQVTFTTPGTYKYQCLVHPEMRAQIVVQ